MNSIIQSNISQKRQGSLRTKYAGFASSPISCKLAMKKSFNIVFLMLILSVQSLRRRVHEFSRNQIYKQSFKIFSERIPSLGQTLDVNLIAANPDLVVSHLKSRRGSEQLISDVTSIKTLRSERNALIVEGDAAKNTRKVLSQQIGQLMKEKRLEEVDNLKSQVESANAISTTADEKLAEIDFKIDKIFSVFPNLLDDR